MACVARNADKLKETVDAVIAAGGAAEAFACDVTQGASVDEVVEKVVGQASAGCTSSSTTPASPATRSCRGWKTSNGTK